MSKNVLSLVTLLLLLPPGHGTAMARNVYQEPDAFIEEVFNGSTPEKKRLWIKSDLKERIRKVLGRDLGLLRVRYWQHGVRTAWILEEIGKTEPITMGFVVNGGTLELVRVLIFRESRGWEIRYPFFTDQYRNATLNRRLELDRHIDGISGATLSVNAANKMARLALVLHQYSDAGGGSRGGK